MEQVTLTGCRISRAECIVLKILKIVLCSVLRNPILLCKYCCNW